MDNGIFTNSTIKAAENKFLDNVIEYSLKIYISYISFDYNKTIKLIKKKANTFYLDSHKFPSLKAC